MRDSYGHASPLYRKYLKSALWRERRRVYFERHPRKCEACDKRAVFRPWWKFWVHRRFIVLHHTSYENQLKRPGNEPDSDLRALCSDCHREVHARYDAGQFGSLQLCTDWLISERQRKLRRQRQK